MARVSTSVGLLVGGLTTAFVVRTLSREWERVRDALAGASWGWIAGGLVGAIAAMAAIAWGWVGVLRLLGASADRRRVIAWYFVGELGKYLPGGVWPVVGRGELARRGGVPRTQAYASVALSLVMLYLAAMTVGAAALPLALAGGGGVQATGLILLLLPVGLAVLLPRVLEPVLGRARRLSRRELHVLVPPWRASIRAVAGYVPAWLLVGLATWSVARALIPDPSLARIFFAAALSWTAGFLAVPVPAGAGVREAVFIAASGLEPGVAATVAVATRVLFILADSGGAAVGAPFLRHRGDDIDAGPTGPGDGHATGAPGSVAGADASGGPGVRGVAGVPAARPPRTTA
ncbi:MAG: flippase-like domain-containing protein [Actinobacteria bacterium]|nr:flippase-like domain-containing protein [Actinomycetota bacterium]